VRRKIILSRKGFDGSTGGNASPIMDGKLVPIPIPRADSGDFYKELACSPTETYLKVMKDLGIRLYSEAHVDPDLQKTILPNRSENWRGLFGQSGASQGTLHNRNVGPGDVFLFFGWYRETKKVNGMWRYVPKAPDIHVIYGYLEVDQVFDLKAKSPVPDWMNYHPHIRGRNEYGTQRNAVYVATPSFSTNPRKQGWGCFQYDQRLILTKEGARNRTHWELPPCFQGEREGFTSGIGIWETLSNGRVDMQTKGRSDQELYIGNNPDVVKWAEELISSCPLY
jgi:hypothetical protein